MQCLRAGCSGTCPGGVANPRGRGSHSLAVPSPRAHPGELPPHARALPHIPMGQPEPPKVPVGYHAWLVLPPGASSARGDKQQPREDTVSCCPWASGAGCLPPRPQQCLACSCSPPPLVPRTGEPSGAPQPGLVPQANLRKTHSRFPLHLPAPFYPCKAPPLAHPFPFASYFSFASGKLPFFQPLVDPPEEALSPDANQCPQHTNSLLQASLFRLNTLHCP